MKLQDKKRKTFVTGLARLLIQISANEPEMPFLGPSKIGLEQLLEQIQLAERRKVILTQDGQRATQEINEKMRAARDQVSRFANLLRATFGPRDERLRRFGIAFLGGQTRANKPPSNEKKKGAPPATTSRR